MFLIYFFLLPVPYQNQDLNMNTLTGVSAFDLQRERSNTALYGQENAYVLNFMNRNEYVPPDNTHRQSSHNLGYSVSSTDMHPSNRKNSGESNVQYLDLDKIGRIPSDERNRNTLDGLPNRFIDEQSKLITQNFDIGVSYNPQYYFGRRQPTSSQGLSRRQITK